MSVNGIQHSQLLPSHISEQTLSETVVEGQVRLVSTSPEANRLAKRIEYSSGRHLLQHLTVSKTQPLKDLLNWLLSCLGRGGDAKDLSADLRLQHTEPTDHAVPPGRGFGNGFKSVLDTVSLLSTSSKINQERFDVTLKAEQIEALQGAIIDGSVNFKDIERMVKTRGDLQLVRTLALSLTHDAVSHKPSIKAALANLATGRPNTSVFLGGLITFLQVQEARWLEKNRNNSEMLLDAQAQNDFISEQLQEHVNNLGTQEANKTLEQLEGYFGQRAHGLMGIASELSGLADDNDQLLSRLARAEGLTDNLISLLRAKLDLPDIRIPSSPTIDGLNQLNPLELAALSSIGIKYRNHD
ncbi:hypothetical protein [Pseudomonas mosselii]|uniref:hypothetical protein n=1 Tax=Pseudomonas mosselii TaxID=78327 RepID=UPI000D84B681|nr:hypothetical protein [Pseudomonas mosselii]PYC18929.1 hypothetical protein DMX06_16840 [Pseudomonas mosselii]